jgi:hypothetical protein
MYEDRSSLGSLTRRTRIRSTMATMLCACAILVFFKVLLTQSGPHTRKGVAKGSHCPRTHKGCCERLQLDPHTPNRVVRKVLFYSDRTPIKGVAKGPVSLAHPTKGVTKGSHCPRTHKGCCERLQLDPHTPYGVLRKVLFYSDRTPIKGVAKGPVSLAHPTKGVTKDPIARTSTRDVAKGSSSTRTPHTGCLGPLESGGIE